MFGLIALVIIGLVVELAAAVAWWGMTGEPFTWGRAAAARASAQVGADPLSAGPPADLAKDRAAQWVAKHRIIVHPFLGFVNDPSEEAALRVPVSSFGFFDARPPLRTRSEDKFIVGVVGGSVAAHFCLYAAEPFAAALHRSAVLKRRTIEIVNLAVGGYKQPQQLMAVQLMLVLGGQFDCIVNLDGFNEVALVNENVPLGVPGWFPRSWARLLDAVPTAEQQLRIGHIAVLAEERAQRVESAGRWSWSPTLQFLWLWRDRRLASSLATLRADAERAAVAPSAAVLGPGTGGLSVAQARAQMVSIWGRASRQLQALCEANGLRYYHFLQPNQYVPDSKPIGAEEEAVAISFDEPWRPAVLDGYPLLRERGRELASEGIAFSDLTRVFIDHPEPLYTDTCCHFGQRGHAIVAEHIAAAIRRDIEFGDGGWKSLQIGPESLRFDSPLARTRLEVIGIDGNGVSHDISGAGFGVRLSADPASMVAIHADGSVRAARRGSAVVRVECNELGKEIALTASWPDIFEGADGRAAGDGTVPIILVDPDEVAAGESHLTLQCRDMPKSSFRLVAAAPQPLPEIPIGVELFGLQLVPIEVAGPRATVRVPIAAPPGQPMFVRFYALTANAGEVMAASNTIVITRD